MGTALKLHAGCWILRPSERRTNVSGCRRMLVNIQGQHGTARGTHLTTRRIARLGRRKTHVCPSRSAEYAGDGHTVPEQVNSRRHDTRTDEEKKLTTQGSTRRLTASQQRHGQELGRHPPPVVIHASGHALGWKASGDVVHPLRHEHAAVRTVFLLPARHLVCPPRAIAVALRAVLPPLHEALQHPVACSTL